jgi:muramoyltetrapeptide carboxypeptidase
MPTPNRQIVFDKKRHLIQIIAPSSRPQTHQGLAKAEQMLTDIGFKVAFSKDLLSQDPSQDKVMWYANTLAKRTQDMHRALTNLEVGIIWCLRGGYGASEVAHHLLAFKKPPLSTPKILIGFSDVTAMHSYMENIGDIPSIHGNNIGSLAANPDSMTQIIKVLKGQDSVIDLTPLNEHANGLAISGLLTGGNLAVLSSLVGTKIAPNFDDKIIILEDINEAGYQIMRYLMHLHYAGLFKKVKAIIFADFSKTDEYGPRALQYFADSNAIAIFKCSGLGHASQNHAVVLNYHCAITKNKLNLFSPFQLSE